MKVAQRDQKVCIECAGAVVLLILKQTPQVSADALRRHYAFLTEICKCYREATGSDSLPTELMRRVLTFHNANEKTVRLAVVTTCELLLKTVDQSNTTEERQDFYQDVAEALKQRVHDKCPKVRERAVAGVAAFQTGKKCCDVTQQLLALLCTDNSADVRRQILRCVAPRKEFLEGYFHGMVRGSRDTVARVRVEAWDALSRFPWRYITAYASAKAVKLPELIMQGLTDTNASVVIACRAAVTNCWLHRDSKDVCEGFLDPIACGYVFGSLTPLEFISQELLTHCLKRTSCTQFKLNLEDIHTSALLMWRASCKYACDTEGVDETQLLLPLEQFSAVLQDAVYAYARPEAQPKVAKFRSVEDADNMLRILLSVVDLYDDNGYLAHADNTTRATLMRLLSFLLKVVPDDDPALFVDSAVRSLRSLSSRMPEEATRTVTAALDSLFRSLKLPQRYALGYDDLEALGRKSRERQQELVRRQALVRTGEVSQEDLDHLREEMERDEKFLLRMQLIVLAFLSHSERGDGIPPFCSHVIHLGRQQQNETVRAAATKSLGMQCLISPDTVHTFMPLILSDTHDTVTTSRSAVPLVTIGVVFDLIMEYGLRFFDTADKQCEGAGYATESALEARLQHEEELANEDCHKVGSHNILRTLLQYLQPSEAGKNAICISGFCKLLSCNRIPHDNVPMVLAQLLLHYMRALEFKKEDPTSSYTAELLSIFFRSYSSSHPVRQESFCTGGVIAFRVLLGRNHSVAEKLISYVTRISDCFILTHIRDIDPETAKRVSKEFREEGHSHGPNASSRSTAARSSMQSGRLLRELSRHSLHETLAAEILLEMAIGSTAIEQRLTCMDALEKYMYFYCKEPPSFLLYCAGKAQEEVATTPELHGRLTAWVEEVKQRFTATATDATRGNSETTYNDAIVRRNKACEELLERGYYSIVSARKQDPLPPNMSKVKQEHSERKRERDNDAFDIEAIVGARRR